MIPFLLGFLAPFALSALLFLLAWLLGALGRERRAPTDKPRDVMHLPTMPPPAGDYIAFLCRNCKRAHFAVPLGDGPIDVVRRCAACGSDAAIRVEGLRVNSEVRGASVPRVVAEAEQILREKGG